MDSEYLEVGKVGGGKILLHRQNPPTDATPHPAGKRVTTLTFMNGVVHAVVAHWHELADFFGVHVHKLDADTVEGVVGGIAAAVTAAVPEAAPVVAAVEPVLDHVIEEIAHDVPGERKLIHHHRRGPPQVEIHTDGPPVGLQHAPDDELVSMAMEVAEEQDRQGKLFLAMMAELGGSPVPGFVGMWQLPRGQFYSFLDFVKGRPIPEPAEEVTAPAQESPESPSGDPETVPVEHKPRGRGRGQRARDAAAREEAPQPGEDLPVEDTAETPGLGGPPAAEPPPDGEQG